MVRMNYGFIILNHSSQRLKVTAVYVAAEYDLIVGCHIDNFLDIPLYSFTLCFYCLMTPWGFHFTFCHNKNTFYLPGEFKELLIIQG